MTQQRHRRAAILKWGLIGLLLATIAGGGYYVLILKPAEGSTYSEADLFEASETSFDIVIPATGELEAFASVEIRSQVERGTTVKWIIDEGARVEAGDTLVELNSEEIKARIEDEQLSVEGARSSEVAATEAVELQRDENESSETQARLKVDLAKLELDRWLQGEVETKRTDLQLDFEKAERNVERFQRDHAESIELEELGIISKSELEADYISMIEAQAELKKAKLNQLVYEEFEYPKEEKTKLSDLEEAKKELARVVRRNESELAQKEADLKNKQEQLRIRERRLEEMQQQLEYCTIVAPKPGLVVYSTSMETSRWGRDEGPLDIGAQVYPNMSLIILPDTTRMVAAVKVHETQSNLIEPGMPAEVKVDAVSDLTLPAAVRMVGVMAQQRWGSQVREYTVKIDVQGENEWELKPSMRCKTKIFLGRVENALSVPVQAVFVDRGKHYVWVPQGRKFSKRPVTVGRSSEMLIEIIDGLSNGETVLLREPAAGERIDNTQ